MVTAKVTMIAITIGITTKTAGMSAADRMSIAVERLYLEPCHRIDPNPWPELTASAARSGRGVGSSKAG